MKWVAWIRMTGMGSYKGHGSHSPKEKDNRPKVDLMLLDTTPLKLVKL